MKITIDKQAQDLRLDKFLRKLLLNASLSSIFKMIRTGKIKVNKKKKKESYRLQEKDIINILIYDEEFKKLTSRSIQKSIRKDFDVLFEDEHILIVNKPVSLASQPGTGVESNNVVAQVYNYLNVKKSDMFRPAPVNRLDRGTSGIMVIGKTPDIIKKLNLMIKEKNIEKYYLAIVLGKLEKKQGEIITHLKRVKENFIDLSKVVDKQEDKAQLAITQYKVIKESNELSLVEVNLKTGRFHQIRAHFAHMLHPILGDPIYGNAEINRKWKAKDQMLHAYKIKFKHPITKKILEITSNPPKEFEDISRKI